MSGREHQYHVGLEWTGNTGAGTSAYRAYERSHDVTSPVAGKPTISGSSDPAFRGDPTRWNPEELLVAALSQCHMLSYLHLCAVAGIVVVAYSDAAEGVMVEDSVRGGYFTRVMLRPTVTVAPGADTQKAHALHERAHSQCFIANSVNFPVTHEPQIKESAA